MPTKPSPATKHVAKIINYADFDQHEFIILPTPTSKWLRYADKFKKDFKPNHKDFHNFRMTYASALMISREGWVVCKEHAKTHTGDLCTLFTVLYDGQIYEIVILVGAFTRTTNANKRRDNVCFANVIVTQ